jgi:3-deoxy-7-phosphoheptulonate synthase
VPILKPFKLVSREFKPENTIITVDGVKIGGSAIVVMAGPCSVENEKQIMTIAKAVRQAGASVLRGSVFKPRTSPYDFQGLGRDGLKLLKAAKAATGLVVETEVMDVRDLDVVAEVADILRIGARNMQNFDLLREVGKIQKPVILKRGLSATIREFLLAAEYIASEGNQQIILCERGIRTFETETRNTLDLNAVPVIKELSHLPIIVDPSHGTGKSGLVRPMSRAAVAAGADGLLIEVHPNPEDAWSDGSQSLKPEEFEELMREVKVVASAVGRRL